MDPRDPRQRAVRSSCWRIWRKPPGDTERHDTSIREFGTLRVRGGNRDWQQTLRRDQLFGSGQPISRTGRLGSHSLRGRRRNLSTANRRERPGEKSYPGDVLHVVSKTAPPKEVYLFQTPARDRQIDLVVLRRDSQSDSWHIQAAFHCESRSCVSMGPAVFLPNRHARPTDSAPRQVCSRPLPTSSTGM